MGKRTDCTSEVYEQIRKDFDEIYETYNGFDVHLGKFLEVKGSYCGDMRCYRYYENGMVTER